MKKRIYIISPFCLSEYPWNWKVYYCVELFSELSKRGYIINWIQPGKNILNFSVFPSLSYWGNFFVINIGNSITFPWLIPFFLSRLKHVSKDIKPFIVIEIIDKKPFELNIDESFFIIPLIFSLGKKWVASNDFPGPVIVPHREIYKDLSSRGVPQKYLNFIPLGIHREKKVTKEEKANKKILIVDKNVNLKPFVEQIKHNKLIYDVQLLNHKGLKFTSPDEFHKWLYKILDEEETISILTKNSIHIGMEILSLGGTIFIPPLEEVSEEQNKESRKIFYYKNISDILTQISVLSNQKTTSPTYTSYFPTWEEQGNKLEKLLRELLTEAKE